MNLKNYLIVVIRILLGAVFLWASIDKIIDPSPEVKAPSLRDLIKGQESLGRKKIETDWQEYIVA